MTVETQEHEQEQATEGNGETSWDDVAQRSQDMQAHTIEEHVRDAERIVEVPLTDEEKGEAADRMAELRAEVNQLEQQKKDAAAHYKSKIDKVNAEVDEIAGEVRSGERGQLLEIREGIDATGHNMVTIRRDTGAVVDVRALTPDERQGRFDFVEGDGEEQDDEGEDSGNVVTHPAAAKPSLEDLDGYTKKQLVDLADRWGIEINAKLGVRKLREQVKVGLFPSFAPAGQAAETGDEETEDQGDGDDAS